jgi:rubrerythrin
MIDVVQLLLTALELQRLGCQMYTQAASRVRDPSARAVLLALAQDERAHESIIRRSYDALVRGKRSAQTEARPEIPGHTLARVKQIVGATARQILQNPTYVGIYESARDMEARSRDLYRDLAAQASSREAVRFLQLLATVEHTHMEALARFVEATREAAPA